MAPKARLAEQSSPSGESTEWGLRETSSFGTQLTQRRCSGLARRRRLSQFAQNHLRTKFRNIFQNAKPVSDVDVVTILLLGIHFLLTHIVLAVIILVLAVIILVLAIILDVLTKGFHDGNAGGGLLFAD